MKREALMKLEAKAEDGLRQGLTRKIKSGELAQE